MKGYTEEQLLIVANLYYIDDMTQEAIAEKLRLSRVTVTRMLKKAQEEGLVQITITKPMPELFGLGLALERKFGLRTAVVAANGTTTQESLEAVGRAGAELLHQLMAPGWRIGAAWSRTVSAILPYVRKSAFAPASVNELAGTYLAPDMPYGVSWALAQKLGVGVESIPVPVLVRSGRVKDVMLRERAVSTALENAASVDLALVGLGNVSHDATSIQTGYIGEEQLAELEARGAVGDVLMRYFDAAGRYIPMSFEDRTIALTWENIVRLPFVVAVAFGPQKLDAIAGALAGGIIHGLVTDRWTAETLLARKG